MSSDWLSKSLVKNPVTFHTQSRAKCVFPEQKSLRHRGPWRWDQSIGWRGEWTAWGTASHSNHLFSTPQEGETSLSHLNLLNAYICEDETSSVTSKTTFHRFDDETTRYDLLPFPSCCWLQWVYQPKNNRSCAMFIEDLHGCWFEARAKRRCRCDCFINAGR